MDGRGNISVLVTSFNDLKYAQTWYVSSFFGTNSIGDDQGDVDFRITPLSSITRICLSTSSRSAKGFCITSEPLVDGYMY